MPRRANPYTRRGVSRQQRARPRRATTRRRTPVRRRVSAYGRGRFGRRGARRSPPLRSTRNQRMSAASKLHFLGQFNPFHHTSVPKILDGAAPFTDVVQQRSSDTFDFDRDKDWYVFLFPNTSLPMTVYNATDDTVDGYFPYAAQPLNIDLTNIDFDNGTAGFPDTKTPGDSGNPNFKAQIGVRHCVHQRVVSSALRFKVINATESQDGWFQAIRFQTPIDEDHWALRQLATIDPDVGDNKNASFLVPTNTFVNDLVNGTNWAQQKGYISSKLNDLNNHQFNLAPQTKEHPFKKVERYIDLPYVASWDGNYNAGTGVFNFDQGEHGFKLLRESMIDDTMDCVAIKITPTSAATSLGSSTLTRLLISHAANIEVVYDKSNDKAHEHTAAYTSAHQKAITDQHQNLNKAAGAPVGNDRAGMMDTS